MISQSGPFLLTSTIKVGPSYLHLPHDHFQQLSI